jgi:hypothetical protein
MHDELSTVRKMLVIMKSERDACLSDLSKLKHERNQLLLEVAELKDRLASLTVDPTPSSNPPASIL